MASIYEELQGVGTEVLTEFNQGVKNYVVVTPGNGPVDQPGTPSETSYGLSGTVTGVQRQYVSGDVVASDNQIIAPVDNRYVPNLKDYITIGGVRYALVGLYAVPPVGTPVVNVFIIRRGPYSRQIK